MAKKKRRFDKKSNHVYHQPKTPYDIHHIFWTGRKWNAGYLASLRQHWYCRVVIPRDTLHRYIHENLAMIPTPRPESAKDALEHLQRLERYGAIHDEDSFVRRLEVLIALFEYVEPRTTEGLRNELGLVYEFSENPPE